MNDKSNQWNDKRCAGQLGGEFDKTDLDELQKYSINFSFRDFPKHKTGIILKAFITKCMTKDNGLVFTLQTDKHYQHQPHSAPRRKSH